ncbi:MAG: CDP-alcohol phosphatidyltransferase family protein [Methanobacteriota archaeon]|nr:MAG: CDP-alcohol phosphatidyltransferase family protein [Euryarchaeota archaeon]
MVLNQFRAPFTKLMKPLYAFLAKLGVTPNFITTIGLAFSIIGGWAFYAHDYGVAALAILLGGLMDTLDGGVARIRGMVSNHGAFLDSVADRIGEAAIYIGLVLGFTEVKNQLAAISLLAAAFSVSYLRARGEGLGVSLAGIGIMERAERMTFLFMAGFLGYLIGEVAVVVIVQVLLVLTAITALHRFVKVYSLLKTTPSETL